MSSPYRYPYTSMVSYPKFSWSRSEAWEHLHSQQIPGCPKMRIIDRVFPEVEKWGHRWVKCHTLTHWAWKYVGGRRG